MNYRLAYALGFHPWEEMADVPEFADAVTAMVEAAEATAPPGRALDVGCGSAVWGVRLAQRGWQVTGVDLVEKALERGRERASAQGVKIRLLTADVTALADEVGSGFSLLLDTGTFHGIRGADARRAMGAELTRVANANATLVLDCFARRWRGPLPRGVDRDEIERCFPDWRIDEVREVDPTDPIARIARFDERIYRLIRA